jgi:hypothetical protein
VELVQLGQYHYHRYSESIWLLLVAVVVVLIYLNACPSGRRKKNINFFLSSLRERESTPAKYFFLPLFDHMLFRPDAYDGFFFSILRVFLFVYTIFEEKHLV